MKERTVIGELYRVLERAESEEREADQAECDQRHERATQEERDHRARELRALETVAMAFRDIAEHLGQIRCNGIPGLRR